MNIPNLTEDLRRIAEARHHDPFEVLGRHQEDGAVVVRANIPNCIDVTIAEGMLPMERIPNTDIFEWRGDADGLPTHYRFIWRDAGHHEHIAHDPYTYPPQLSEFDLHLFAEGKHWHAYRFLGANEHEVAGVAGALFAVWAPNAERVSVVGDFNRWDGRSHPMRVRPGYGVWELFIPDLSPGVLYKFEIRNRQSGKLYLKSDPYGRQFELRPQTASIVAPRDRYQWNDEAWLRRHCPRITTALDRLCDWVN